MDQKAVAQINLFIESQPITILSTIARLSGGTYDPLPDFYGRWRRYTGSYSRLPEPVSGEREQQFIAEYMTPMLLCGKPESIDLRRWFIKSLSNDQTAFTGFTSLVDVVSDNNSGFECPINLVPGAVFVEPFALNLLDEAKQTRLFEIAENIKALNATNIGSLNEFLQEAETLSPVVSGRKKGKSPIFFYGIADKVFKVPQELYQRMTAVTQVVYAALAEESQKLKGSRDSGRLAFTGSIDFMVLGDDLYVIDIGFPAVGYVADILAASAAVGRDYPVGIEKILASIPGSITVVESRLTRELGFFKLEREYLVSNLRVAGVKITDVESEEYEAIIKGRRLPDKVLDYVSRNQPVRDRVLREIKDRLEQFNARLPESTVLIPDDFNIARFYEQTTQGIDFGLLVKKKVLFTEYEPGKDGYFKPLITPLWSRELLIPRGRSAMFEQFLPSLIDVNILGDRPGKRSYEIRMYFVAGETND